MLVTINRKSSTPVYKQIERELRNKILNNMLVFGSRLPSERQMASSLGVHRNTVVKAYKYLVDQGLISSQFQGRKGYFVIFDAEGEAEKAFEKKRPAVFKYSHAVNYYDKLSDAIYQASFDENIISFGRHVYPKELIPFEEIKEVMNLVVEKEGVDAFSYCSSRGSLQLRKRLALVLQDEGIFVGSGEMVIINEASQGVEYVAKLLTQKHDYVISEEPIPPSTFKLFQDLGLQVLMVPLEEDGVNLIQLENLIRKYKPKLFHTMPDYHAVTGVRMSLAKRYAVLELCAKHDLPIIEEGWFSDVHFDDVLPSLFALDKRKSVIKVDAALTKFYYGARICYLLAQGETAARIGRSINYAQLHLQRLEQDMFAEYLEAGYHVRQQRRMCQHYREKYEKLCHELEPLRELGASWQPIKGGLALWCRLPEGVNDMRYYEALKEKGVLISPGRMFVPYGTESSNYIHLSFSNISDEAIEKGTAIMRDVLAQLLMGDVLDIE